jgi:hypothetical protein
MMPLVTPPLNCYAAIVASTHKKRAHLSDRSIGAGMLEETSWARIGVEFRDRVEEGGAWLPCQQGERPDICDNVAGDGKERMERRGGG